MRIVIFGTGGTYRESKRYFQNSIIDFFIDNDEKKWGKLVDGGRVLSPYEASQREIEMIYILSIHEAEIRQQLINLGISGERIRDRHDLALMHEFPKQKYFPVAMCENRNMKRILMITHELSLTGAPIMLLYAAMALKKAGVDVTVVSPADGNLRNTFLENNIPVLIDESLPFTKLDYLSYVDEFDVIFVNTLAFYYLYASYNRKVPVIWWIHEGETAYRQCFSLPYVDYSGCKIMACSRRAEDAFRKRCPDYSIDVQLYGIKDFYHATREGGNKKRVFAVIGTVEERKAQDIFLKAIRRLPEEVRTNSEFWIIGNDTAEYARDFVTKLKKEAENIPQVVFLHEQTRSKMEQIFHEIDVLVCPSLEESMSIVSIEAMLCHKPCIVTKQTGISDYICDGENGFICSTADDYELAEKMAYCYFYPEHVNVMGKLARKTYETVFSLSNFEEEIVKKVIPLLK